jgi:integrase
MAVRKRVEKGIYRAGDTYEVVVSGARDADGKYRQTWRTVHGGLRDARRERARLSVEVGAKPPSSLPPPPPSMTVGELFTRFMAHKVTLAPRTVELYDGLWTRHIEPVIGSIPVTELSARQIDDVYLRASKTLGAVSTRKVHKLISAVLTQGVKWELVGRNAAVSASPPKEEKHEIAPPVLEDFVKILRAATAYAPEFGALVRLAAVTGARRGELCGLRWSDFDPFAGTLSISRQVVIIDESPVITRTKTKAARVLPLDEATIAMVAAHRERSAEKADEIGIELTAERYMFSLAPGSEVPLRPDGVTARFRKVVTRAGVQCRFHDLRHFCGSQMIAAGIDAKTVADRLGHANPVVTLSFYTHSVTKTQRQAADVIGSVIAGV